MVSDAAIPAADQFLAFAPPGHACFVTEHGSEHFALLARFARIGLERAEQCVLLHAEGDEATLVQALRVEGIDVDTARTANALILIYPREANLKGDSFDPYRLLSFWKRLASRVRAAGFTAVRGAVAMSSVSTVSSAEEVDRWLEYEAQLTELAEDHRCLFLCHYTRRALNSRQLLDVIRRHSSIIHLGEIAPNIHHVRSREASNAEASGLGLEGILADAANRARIERLHRQREQEGPISERRLEVALASCTVPFVILAAKRNAQGSITGFTWAYANPAAARALGKSAEELIGAAVFGLVPPLWSSTGLFQSLVQAVETGRQASWETSFTSEGGLRWWQYILSKVDDGVAVWFLETTERKQAEEQYRRSLAHLGYGERLSHTGSWAWDVSSRELSFWSPGYLRIVGFDTNTRPSWERLLALVHSDDLPSFEEQFKKAVRKLIGFDHEFRILRADGIRYVRSIGLPMLDEHGALVEYAGTLIDITERRESESDLRAYRATLARVARLTTLGELSTSIAHEVNQPLGAIILHGDAARRWLARKRPNAQEALRAVEGMMSDAHRARDVIARIRTLASKADQPHEVLDMNGIVRDVLEITRGELLHSDIVVRTELASAWVRGDRVQLQQVLLNLIMNAVEAMNAREQGPRELLIRTFQDSEQSVHIEVRDSGIGVSEESLSRIFEPFYTTKSQGIGIGLSISHSIIEAHSGRLWAQRHETAPGLSLHIVLPSATPSNDSDAASS